VHQAAVARQVMIFLAIFLSFEPPNCARRLILYSNFASELPYGFNYILIGYAPPFPSVHTLHVEEIPAQLNDDETQSNSASTMFSSKSVKIWFRNLINATDLQFNHPDESDDDPYAPRTFDAYIPNFQRDGFKRYGTCKIG
jgi:hypothetical protein